MKQSMKRMRDGDMNFSENPQLNIMEVLVRKAMNPFRFAFGDLEQTLVTKEGGAEQATEVNDKLLKFFRKEISEKYAQEAAVVMYGDDTDIPATGAVWVAHSCGSLVNLSHGNEDVCIYIAYVVDGKAESAVVLYPITNEIYAIEKGKGARSRTRRLRVTGRDMLENSLVSVFSPITSTEDDTKFLDAIRAVRAHKCHTRISGNVIHDALSLSAAKLDAMVAMNLNPMDVLVAEFIIRESGGYTCEIDNSTVEIGSTSIIAANHKLQGKLLKVLATV
ncbi:MAG: myo-inositol-1(or 4)-monophosphatase [Alphaproteobacteria bacterium]|jgi:myo-inositol-1(or 4)-monophosphatase